MPCEQSTDLFTRERIEGLYGCSLQGHFNLLLFAKSVEHIVQTLFQSVVLLKN